MTTGIAPDPTKAALHASEFKRTVALSGRFEEPLAREQRLQRTRERDPWKTTGPTATLSPASISVTSPEPPAALFASFQSQSASQWLRDPRVSRSNREYPETTLMPQWPTPSLPEHQLAELMSPSGEMGSRAAGYTGYNSSWPGPLLRRTSSEDARLSRLGGYFSGEASSSAGSLQHVNTYPQRRPSNRDEFDGPAQLLDRPDESGYEPKEEDLPQLPITLYAQEQDQILSKVNDRLSKCAFDFIARYQFPIPIEPDKRPVRVPGDREWSEWVYLLKRLATKRRIPSRVLYNGQIKQLITILENSLEMRHAAKHQSRPLKDDRNILQLISSGLQVAKILKDAPAMHYLDSLYVQTEGLMQSRRMPVPPTTYAG